jgi:hypothetical protein
MLLDYKLFSAFESDEKQWPYSLSNIVSICDRISEEDSSEEISSLPQEYMRSLFKVARCYELEGKVETLGSGGSRDHGSRIEPALTIINNSSYVESIQNYKFVLVDFIDELKQLLDGTTKSIASFTDNDVISVEYHLHSHLLFSESRIVIYSLP